jgi:integrase
MDLGGDPTVERRETRANGITLLEARGDHIERLKAKSGSPRSIEDIIYVTGHYLADWLERPISSIDRAACVARHRKITEENGPVVGNRALRVFRAVWNTAAKQHDLPGKNPTVACIWNAQQRRRSPVEDLAAWRQKIEALGPVRRDALLTIALTGLRVGDATHLRWENLSDLDTKPIAFLPSPKGGPRKAFYIPLAQALVEVLKRRKAENPVVVGGDGDEGWVFPTRGKDGKVKPIAQLRWGPKGESPHRLRDRYVSTALDLGIRFRKR